MYTYIVGLQDQTLFSAEKKPISKSECNILKKDRIISDSGKRTRGTWMNTKKWSRSLRKWTGSLYLDRSTGYIKSTDVITRTELYIYIEPVSVSWFWSHTIIHSSKWCKQVKSWMKCTLNLSVTFTISS